MEGHYSKQNTLTNYLNWRATEIYNLNLFYENFTNLLIFIDKSTKRSKNNKKNINMSFGSPSDDYTSAS
jgi:hypothetical protein